jgi:hypothetical protein
MNKAFELIVTLFLPILDRLIADPAIPASAVTELQTVRAQLIRAVLHNFASFLSSAMQQLDALHPSLVNLQTAAQSLAQAAVTIGQ